ncbi:Class F sortase OS=Streptomyces alboniger OX=132473 GN=CP975_28335 PE=4 SV=1 [Streptomyces alboniger]
MRRRRGRGGRVGVVVLAGWLFADLLLVLALVSMADRPDPLADDRPKPSPSKPVPSPTGPRAVDRNPREFKVSGDDKGDLVQQIGRSTRKWKGRTAALVLTFGGGPNGTVYAHRVNALLGKGRPDMFTRKTATDDFHNLGRDEETAVVRVYFYTAPGG